MAIKHRILAVATLGGAMASASASMATIGAVVFDISLNTEIQEVNGVQVSSTPVDINYIDKVAVALPAATTSLLSVYNTPYYHIAENDLYTPVLGSSSSLDAQLFAAAGIVGQPNTGGNLDVQQYRIFDGPSSHQDYAQVSEYQGQNDNSFDGYNYTFISDTVSTTIGYSHNYNDPHYIGDPPPLLVSQIGAYMAPFTYGVDIDANYSFEQGNIDVGDTSDYSTDEIFYGTATLDLAASDFVPEPASWALMILGFGFAGAGLRRCGAVGEERLA
ncbi:PEPxxWA-CTERM sorting domain-containing protein [Phenylobacterium sp.]|uniref:PEPxxWA-CTERM sorting domain-containing protein n=1 Tax=Phenylobacterium sp. TaxID=1871053 RepID=UPI0025F7B093|nr:PEPxxWA-CTERM sorting domain-containing protein [Phenylobacterium sp.]